MRPGSWSPQGSLSETPCGSVGLCVKLLLGGGVSSWKEEETTNSLLVSVRGRMGAEPPSGRVSRRFSFPRVTMENMNQKPGPHLGGRSVGAPGCESEAQLCGGRPVISRPGTDFPWMPGFCSCLSPGGPCPAGSRGSGPCCSRLALMTADGGRLGDSPVTWDSVSNPQSSPRGWRPSTHFADEESKAGVQQPHVRSVSGGSCGHPRS